MEEEFRDVLPCGVLAHGFARVHCGDCPCERLVPFSCKGRGFGPSCGGRCLAERAAHLGDAVLPRVPVRQWVLSLPHRLRYLLAWSHPLCRAVLGVFVRALLGFQRHQGRRRGIRAGQAGSLPGIPRCGGGRTRNVPCHPLGLDGVCTETETGALRFPPALPPGDEDVARLLAPICTRMRRLLQPRGLERDAEGMTSRDPVAGASRALASITSGSVLGRVTLGPRAGARVLRLGGEPHALGVPCTGPNQALLEGVDLHANLLVPAEARARLAQRCRSRRRPPVAQDRLRLTGDGRVLLELKSAWHAGTSHLLVAPLELLETRAARTPTPRVTLVLYHGLLAPPCALAPPRWRLRGPHDPCGGSHALLPRARAAARRCRGRLPARLALGRGRISCAVPSRATSWRVHAVAAACA